MYKLYVQLVMIYVLYVINHQIIAYIVNIKMTILYLHLNVPVQQDLGYQIINAYLVKLVTIVLKMMHKDVKDV